MDEQQTTSTCIVVSMLGGEVVLNRKQVEHIVEVSGKLEAQRNQLRAERDALKERVEELGLAVKAYKEKHQGCHTMEFSPCATCDFIDAVQEWVDDTKNTTPGGDE